MAKRKRKARRRSRRRMTALQRKYFGRRKRRHTRKAAPMARKRRRRHHTKRRGRSRRGHRRSHGGITGGIMGDAGVIVGAAIYGVIEDKAKADPAFIANKLPKPIAGLGFAGNTALALYLLGYFTRNRIVKLGARSVAAVAAYQLARNKKLFAAGTDIPTLSGPGYAHSHEYGVPPGQVWPGIDSNHHVVGDDDLGALEYEDEHDALSHT